MKKFKFPLEGLYRWRKEEERQAVMIVQGLQMRENGILQKIRNIEELRWEWVATYNQCAMKEKGQADLILIERYLGVLDQNKNYEETMLRKVREDLRAATEAARKVYRALKQVEHLRDARRHKFEEEFRRHEQKGIDEINSLRFVPKDGEVKEERL
jgi:flagellar export protein FliJ